jgi:glycosyltransferase involved in cell wall biosynthesis
MITLILTGGDRCDDLERFFASLEIVQLNRFKDIQLIFVNQGNYTPKTRFDYLSSINYCEINTKKISLSYARNIGLKMATGEIIGFPDDDCWYSENLLNQIMLEFNKDLNLDAICTNVYDPVKKQTYGGRPVGINCAITFYNLFELPISVGIFLRKTSFEKAGFYFDENLGAGTIFGSGEESDLIYRLLKSRARLVYFGSIQVYHPVPTYDHQDINKYYKYGLGFGFLNGKILRDGQWRVLRNLLHVISRSIIGCLIYIFNPIKRRLYLRRLVGISVGLLKGLKAPKGKSLM